MTCDCSKFTGRNLDLCEGRGHDGRPDPSAKAVAVFQRRNKCKPWDVSQPSRGLGDTIAKFMHAIGISKAVKAVAGEKCGCEKRQAAANAAVPYA
jgi:hypothetical protein